MCFHVYLCRLDAIMDMCDAPLMTNTSHWMIKALPSYMECSNQYYITLIVQLWSTRLSCSDQHSWLIVPDTACPGAVEGCSTSRPQVCRDQWWLAPGQEPLPELCYICSFQIKKVTSTQKKVVVVALVTTNVATASLPYGPPFSSNSRIQIHVYVHTDPKYSTLQPHCANCIVLGHITGDAQLFCRSAVRLVGYFIEGHRSDSIRKNC